MKIYTTKRGDEVFLDDEEYKKLIVKMGYTYCVSRNKKRKIESVRRRIPAKLSDTGKQKTQYIHWDVIGRPEKGMVTDHIDGNPLNNQKDNLRICSVRENAQNYRHKTNTRKYSSKYPGVHWHKENEKWMAYITINKKIKYLGYFLNEQDAAQAYKKACEIFKDK